MMGDIFELGTLELLNSMIEAIFRNLEVDEVFRLCEEEFEKVGEMIDTTLTPKPTPNSSTCSRNAPTCSSAEKEQPTKSPK